MESSKSSNTYFYVGTQCNSANIKSCSKGSVLTVFNDERDIEVHVLR